jgi:hypothetical protein
MTLETELMYFVRRYSPRDDDVQRARFVTELRDLMNRYAEEAIVQGRLPEVGGRFEQEIRAAAAGRPE